MSALPDPHTDRLAGPSTPARGVARPGQEWTPGFTDGLGTRFLEFDIGAGTSVERLLFKREWSDSAAFEAAVRDRIEKLQAHQHPALASVKSVTRVPGRGLVLESKPVTGRRLSELLFQGRGTVPAMEFIRQLVPALAQIHKSGDGVAHGIIGLDRIIAARDGRLVLMEPVVGSAISLLQLAPDRLRSEFGLALPITMGPSTLDSRSDLVQIGFIALSLLLSRKLSPTDYPGNIDRLVGECAQLSADRSAEAAWLRRWAERALQVGPDPFTSIDDAVEMLSELSDTGELQTAIAGVDKTPTPARTPMPVIVPAPAPVPVAVTSAPTPVPAPIVTAPTPVASTPAPKVEPPKIVKPVAVTTKPAPAPAPANDPPVWAPASAPTTPSAPMPRATTPASVPAPAAHATHAAPAAPAVAKHAAPAPPAPRRRWLVPGLALLAVGEALAIVGLMLSRPLSIIADEPKPPVVQNQPTARTEPPAPVTPQPTEQKPAAKPEPPARPAADPAPPVSAAAGDRFGGLRVTSPIALQIAEGGKVIGSTLSPLALLEGPHVFDVSNDALEFKTRVNANVRGGQMSGITITLPNGRININAVPWADVTLDGKSAGQTPLANLSVTIGDHEVIFRHPQLGEVKQTVTVKAETPARVSITFPK